MCSFCCPKSISSCIQTWQFYLFSENSIYSNCAPVTFSFFCLSLFFFFFSPFSFLSFFLSVFLSLFLSLSLSLFESAMSMLLQHGYIRALHTVITMIINNKMILQRQDCLLFLQPENLQQIWKVLQKRPMAPKISNLLFCSWKYLFPHPIPFPLFTAGKAHTRTVNVKCTFAKEKKSRPVAPKISNPLFCSWKYLFPYPIPFPLFAAGKAHTSTLSVKCTFAKKKKKNVCKHRFAALQTRTLQLDKHSQLLLSKLWQRLPVTRKSYYVQSTRLTCMAHM